MHIRDAIVCAALAIIYLRSTHNNKPDLCELAMQSLSWENRLEQQNNFESSFVYNTSTALWLTN